MNTFKTKQGLSKIHPISPDAYRTATKMRFPFVQKNKDGSKTYYAICPYCEQGIQIKGNLFRSDGIIDAYGAHIEKQVAGLPYYNEETVRQCPAYTGKDPYVIKKDINPKNSKVIRCKKEIEQYADRIAWLIEKHTGLHISEKAMSDMYWRYNNKKKNLLHVRDNALPWILCAMDTPRSIKGRWIRKGTPLYMYLDSRPDVTMQPKGNGYASVQIHSNIILYYKFTRHIVTMQKETIHFCLYVKTKQERIVYSKTIEIDQNEFYHLCNNRNWATNPYVIERIKSSEKKK